ncbi:PepSY domain-containing protein, partial [Streptomyces sp. NPDC052644]
PPRGGVRGLPWWAVLVGVPVVVAVGWALPLLGLSLVAFLAVDVVLGLAARRRDTAPAPAGE